MLKATVDMKILYHKKFQFLFQTFIWYRGKQRFTRSLNKYSLKNKSGKKLINFASYN